MGRQYPAYLNEQVWSQKGTDSSPFVNLALFNPGGGTLGISGWGCAAGTLEPLAYIRASSAKFCFPLLE